MKEYVILCAGDMEELACNRPVDIYVDGKTLILCTDEYYENNKQNTYNAEGFDMPDKK